MLFEDILITILKAVDGERTISSPYHLVKGKKSGQTLQDIGYYRLFPYFGILPRLEKSVYDQAVHKLYSTGCIINDGNVVRVTEKALNFAANKTLLNGWKFRGNEQIFMSRLSLLVQTFSHIHQNSKQFDPVVISEDIQYWVKNYLRKVDYRNPENCMLFKKEIAESLELVDIDIDQKLIVMQRLSGFKVGGLTWQQIAVIERQNVIDVQLRAIEALHGWMEVIEKENFPMLQNLLEGIIQQSALTETAKQTEYYYKNGRSLEEIAAIRGLKTSTIEDHFVELAMNDPSFDVLNFMDVSKYNQIIAISETSNTKRLRDIKGQVQEADYFQIRLALASKGEMK